MYGPERAHDAHTLSDPRRATAPTHVRRRRPGDRPAARLLVEEAIANNTMQIPPLTETLEEVAAWLDSTLALGLWHGGRLIGLIRGSRAGDAWEVGRIGVVPDLRGHHLGWWLMDEIEARAGESCTRYELFTGANSERNISLYERRGYVRMAQMRPGLVYLDKPIPR